MNAMRWSGRGVLLAWLALCGSFEAPGADGLTGTFTSAFYRAWPLFSTAPSEAKALQTVDRFGPVGIGIELHLPAFVMKVKNVEPGSPAEATGKLKPGQIIESINGQTLKDIDPRITLGGIITQAEATDGKVRLRVKAQPEEQAEEVVVQIPVLGAYSPTWPLNCPKSDKIVRHMADYLARTGNHAGPGIDLGLLFMLSTGEEQDLEVARRWIKEVAAKYKDSETIDVYPWHIGYGGVGLCEYYLRTGDAVILPVIEKLAERAKRTMYNGGWNTRGGPPEYNYYSGGQMNAAGVHCLTFLLLAKECGAVVDEYTLQRSLKQFFRFAGRGNTPYGDHLPESGFVDNGKVGGLAFAMAAAASLTPDGEQSVYAKARDISAIKGFYSTSWMLHGHTGGGIGEIWRSAAMGLMADKKPVKYREFMDNRRWHYELSRRYDGSFGILGGERYDADQTWGNAYALAYTIPRKTLRITGAPPTKFCKTHPLPARPWGTAADDAFYSLVPAPDPRGKAQDVDAEKLATDASWPILRRLNDSNVSDEVLRMYCRHPDQGVREMAYGVVRNQNRDRLIVELLRDKDPRARHAGAMAASLFSAGKGRAAAPERLTEEMVQLLIGMVEDPEESWWAVRAALAALSLARPELLAPHVERLTYWVQHEEWWLQGAALGALVGLAADERFYQQVLPPIGRMVAQNRVMSLASQWGALGQLRDKLAKAGPQVQALAVRVLAEAYAKTPVTLSAPGGLNMDAALDVLVQEQAAILSKLPGGLEELYRRARTRYPGRALPHPEIFLTADPTGLGADLQANVRRAIRERVIPEFVGAANHIASNRKLLLQEATSAVPFVGNFYYREPRLEELVRLYNRLGVHDYDWHDLGPAFTEMAWDYFSFDPPERKPPGTGWRYRPVTYPAGMTNWFAVDFDAAKAGWKRGLQPFGQEDGKLVTERRACRWDFCRCGEPMRTLWEKEVLLVRGTFTFPKFREGYCYRLLVGNMSEVGRGEGFRIYVNGKLLFERARGIDRREGGAPTGYTIDKAWWPEFAKPVVIAATSFLRIENGGKQGNRFFLWLQEMKAPPVEQLIRESATVVPMTSSAWQARQNNPDTPDVNPAEGKFLFDGKFVANKALLGPWTVVAQVAAPEAFQGAAATFDPKAVPFTAITFKDNGATDSPLRIWSGDVLMNLERNEALKMILRQVAGAECLFVEAGGFSEKNPFGWKPAWLVLKRAAR